ncbi:MAG: hydrogenase maturation nickel metallochaperone HypA [Methyloprofundus sp.]|nr:hydrogenase maturation nickel metallochaperone HypA [Methyloprofundus sp.]
MHEISLLEQVRETLIEHAQSQNFNRVSQVTLEIGKLSCVEAEALRFGFDVVMNDSLIAGAELVITSVDGLGVCQNCHKSVAMETLHDPCSYCGQFQLKVIQGEGMRIKDLLVT